MEIKSKILVIGGGSGNGKSEIINELRKRGYNTHLEPAREFLEQRAKEQGPEVYAHPTIEENIYRQTEIYKRMVSLEYSLRELGNVHFIERSALECLAFNEHFLGNHLQIIKEMPFRRVDQIFIPVRLEFELDGIRTEKDEKQSRAIHDTILRDYFEEGYQPHSIPKMSGTKKEQVEKRTDLVMKLAAKEGHLEDVYEFNSNSDMDERLEYMKNCITPLKKIKDKLYDFLSQQKVGKPHNAFQITEIISTLSTEKRVTQENVSRIISDLERDRILINLGGKKIMGDYGFEGAVEFGGQDGNFHCKPDKNIQQCPYVRSYPNDALRSIFIEYECMASLRPKECGEFGGPSENAMCDARRFEDCKWYKEESVSERKRQINGVENSKSLFE